MAEKSTGSVILGMDVSDVAQATECDEPQATRLTLTPSRLCTNVGFRLTRIVPLPCCP